MGSASVGEARRSGQLGRGFRRRAVLTVVLLGALAAACSTRTSPPNSRLVTVFGTLSDREADDFIASLASFEASTGIDVRYIGTSNFESDLVERVRRGDPPDLALVPQPGLARALNAEGWIVPWSGESERAATAGVDRRLVDLAREGGTVFGAWYQRTLKSLVWYSPREFARDGYEVPSSWAELESLSTKARAAGVPTWCIGIRDGGASGWVASDWVEDLLLRFSTPEVYDEWVDHRTTFSAEPVRDAVQRFGSIALDGGLVYRGDRAAAEFTAEQSARQLLAPRPTCLLHRQASFLPRMLADASDRPLIAPDGDLWAFPLPSVDGGSPPLIDGGTLAVRFTETDDAASLATYLTTADAARRRVNLGGFIPARDVPDFETLAEPIDATVMRWITDAKVIRFDASDQMPPDVGVGSFWAGMVSYVSGANLTTVLDDIDTSWPASPVPQPEANDG